MKEKRELHFTAAKPVLSLALSLMVLKAVQSQCSSFMLMSTGVIRNTRKLCLEKLTFKAFF